MLLYKTNPNSYSQDMSFSHFVRQRTVILEYSCYFVRRRTVILEYSCYFVRQRTVILEYSQCQTRLGSLVCGRTGSTLLGPLQKITNFDGLGKKVRPDTFMLFRSAKNCTTRIFMLDIYYYYLYHIINILTKYSICIYIYILLVYYQYITYMIA